MFKSGVWWLTGMLGLIALSAALLLCEPPQAVGNPPGGNPADNGSAKEADPLPAELEDPAFDRYIKWRGVGRAYAAFDSGRLTDLFLQLREGERVLRRSHRAVSAETLFTDAVEMAQRKRDTASLERLEEAARVWGRAELQAKAASARQAAGRPGIRALDVPADGLPAPTVALIQALKTGIESASLLGDRDALQEYQHRIGVSDRLPEATKERLLKEVTAALKAPPRPANDTSRALRGLTAASRDLSPAEYAGGRTSWLHSQGYLRETDKKVWVEHLNNTTFRLRETARTRQYVDLHDSARKLTIRLDSMKAVARQDEEKDWQPRFRGHWEDPSLIPLNEMKLPDVHTYVEKNSTRSFPLLGTRFEVLGPATPKYNCIAWSLGITDHWVWPGERITDFDQLNGQHGFHRSSDRDFGRRVRIDKIVLYAKKTRGQVVATHQARQMADGSWLSKLGALPLIRHVKPEDLDGDVYGVPEAVYVRERKD